jgi:hypothetical protein
MTSPWPPYRETLGATLSRTGAIAVVMGGVAAARSGGGLGRWAAGTALALWPALGGHFVELWFLNWLRQRLPMSRGAQAVARLSVWFVGGVVLMLCMRLTAMALDTFTAVDISRWPRWWMSGVAFIGIELFVHLVLYLLGKPSFYDPLRVQQLEESR